MKICRMALPGESWQGFPVVVSRHGHYRNTGLIQLFKSEQKSRAGFVVAACPVEDVTRNNNRRRLFGFSSRNEASPRPNRG